MKDKRPLLLAVIPARGGSKGLPGKNMRSFAGLPLIAHSILFARMCPEIERTIVSTDSAGIRDAALRYDADIPFLRPAPLAQDDTPMWPVLRHALAETEREEGRSYEFLLLLDPTSPAREPADIREALKRLRSNTEASGIIGVSEPSFNPLWHCVVEEGGWMRDLVPGAGEFARRQDVPRVFRVNGSLYIWRTEFVRKVEDSWKNRGRYLIYEIPEIRAMSIDDAFQFEQAELLVKQGMIRFPWLCEAKAV
ncbi:MAG: acylneuraminate cytidylyltransferase family protein [Candidatus Omnitrophica bacterium]|nr:acylneuraminate cytidylyltransferase family protein [Candidatus Omnitrophota bacterium]